MDYVSLGRTGVQVSRLCLGTMNFGGVTDRATATTIVAEALDRGVNCIDTANIYNGGRSEEIVGHALRETGRRDRVVLATKAHVQMDPDDPNSGKNHRRHIIEQCRASLKRLGTDYIDIFYIHRPSTQIPIDETLRALDDVVRAGDVRYIASSDFAAWKIIESLWVAKEYGLDRFVCEQSAYHLLDRRAERELFPMTQSYGIGVTVWSPLAGGFLAGAYRRDEARPAEARLSDSNEWADRHFVPRAFDVVETVVELAREKGCSPAQLAIAWCLRHPAVCNVAVGPKTVEQAREILDASTVSWSAAELERLDRVSIPAGSIVPYYIDDSFADVRPNRFHWI
ncbi:MAG: aldo/keto reductase [Spirochaetales bacterium]|nr:aldo/keto reductase [Spirochaetales bacterium]